MISCWNASATMLWMTIPVPYIGVCTGVVLNGQLGGPALCTATFMYTHAADISKTCLKTENNTPSINICTSQGACHAIVCARAHVIIVHRCMRSPTDVPKCICWMALWYIVHHHICLLPTAPPVLPFDQCSVACGCDTASCATLHSTCTPSPPSKEALYAASHTLCRNHYPTAALTLVSPVTVHNATCCMGPARFSWLRIMRAVSYWWHRAVRVGI